MPAKNRCEIHRVKRIPAPSLRNPNACIYTCLDCPYKIVRPEMLIGSHVRCSYKGCENTIQITGLDINNNLTVPLCDDHKMIRKRNKEAIAKIRQEGVVIVRDA